jgi:hypothetical protein
MVDPAVCVPYASGTIAAPTAATDPLDEPPGVRFVSCGLRVSPGCRVANSVETVLPRTIAPALRVSATQAASLASLFPA